MTNFQVWLVYIVIVASSYVIMKRTIGSKNTAIRVIGYIAGFAFITIGITFVVMTVVLATDKFFPDASGGSSDETCIPDHRGGC